MIVARTRWRRCRRRNDTGLINTLEAIYSHTHPLRPPVPIISSFLFPQTPICKDTARSPGTTAYLGEEQEAAGRREEWGSSGPLTASKEVRGKGAAGKGGRRKEGESVSHNTMNGRGKVNVVAATTSPD